MKYDKNNVFHKIIHGELRAKTVLDGEHFMAFHDIAPKAPVHVLIIPKGNYVDYNDFSEHASDAEILDFNRAISKVVRMMRLENGFKMISNAGKFGMPGDERGQEVMHMHVHILGKPSDE
ncbi:MAG: HIT domain-containing protein [Holosporales bacterium]|jgi:histidine triad (HIT) family protein|nr:HIT domain-containing protein [Holosporales bacterium]